MRRPWALAGAGAGLALLAALVGTLLSLLGAELGCVGGGGGAGPAPPRAAAGEIPPARLSIYRAAGQRFDISWPFLAAIGTQECGSGGCAGVNSSGCAGPMQIAYVRESPCSPGPGPTIWERLGTDGDGDGRAEVNDPADAIFTAARLLRTELGAPPAGGSAAAYREAACSYYGACADASADYAAEVMARALRYGFGGEGTPAPGPGVRYASTGGGCAAPAGGGGGGSTEIVRIARSQLGRGESPPGSNCNPFGPCVQWCSLFVAWVWKRAGVPLEGDTSAYAYSGSVYEWAEAHEGGGLLAGGTPLDGDPLAASGARALPPGATPAPGDAVLFGSGPEASDHIALVEQVLPGGQITTIDGNFGDRVVRVGPYLPSQAAAAGEPAPVYGYARPPGPEEGAGSLG